MSSSLRPEFQSCSMIGWYFSTTNWFSFFERYSLPPSSGALEIWRVGYISCGLVYFTIIFSYLSSSRGCPLIHSGG
jgi:hypothetical protein